MVARSHNGSSTASCASRADGTTEASVLQAFLVQLERKGLVHGDQSHARNGARGAASADIEIAVRKLIAALREPS
jgi:hypothetical protein